MHARSPRTALITLSAIGALVGLALAAPSCATAGNGGTPSGDASTDGPGIEDSTTASDTYEPPPDTGGGSACDAGNTMTDPNNCGACGVKCPSGNTCSCGQCTPPCSGGLIPCCGQCVDVETDPNNCGNCGLSCTGVSGGNVPGTPTCVNAQCSFTCPQDAGLESGAPVVTCGADAGSPGCYDLTTSAASCGACGHACPAGDDCVDSQCCPAGDGICGGTCTPLNTAQNCGACGSPCPAPAMCTNGMCVGYVETTAPQAFLDACAQAGSMTFPSLLGGSWEASTAFSLPFNFSFYGTAETKAFLGSEGTLGFGGANLVGYPDCSGSGPPPIFTDYGAIVAFGDPDYTPGKVCLATIGTAPNRQLVATWDQGTEIGDPTFALQFSIVLSETTNAIDLLYYVPSAPPDGGLDGGLDGGEDAGSAGDGGIPTSPVSDPLAAGSNATIGMQLNGTTNTPLSCDKAFLTYTPVDVHLVP